MAAAFHTFSRQRNNSRDHRPYHFEYIHRPWHKNPAIRQIIVRATNPNGKTVQLSILTDDTQRPVREIVRLMFNRWIQENDFKYLNKHFGINQLTSYRSTPYEQHLDELNAGGLTLPDGSGRPLRLRLTRKEQISVRINDVPPN